ncbi:MAG: KTSC domain-containing protein [Caulobacteraceae bacterium]
MPHRESEAIEDISYDETRQRMRITFTTGRIYDYLDVPIDEYEAFYAAESSGRYFNAQIRDRYEHREAR